MTAAIFTINQLSDSYELLIESFDEQEIGEYQIEIYLETLQG